MTLTNQYFITVAQKVWKQQQRLFTLVEILIFMVDFFQQTCEKNFLHETGKSYLIPELLLRH